MDHPVDCWMSHSGLGAIDCHFHVSHLHVLHLQKAHEYTAATDPIDSHCTQLTARHD